MSEFDDTTLYEIVQFADGHIGLKHADESETDEPLVVIRFSEQAKYFLNEMASDGDTEVAKAMIEAGLEAVQELQARAQATEPVKHLVH